MVQNIAAAHVPHPVYSNHTGAVGRDEAAPLFAGCDFFPNTLHNAIPAFQHIHAGDAVKKGGAALRAFLLGITSKNSSQDLPPLLSTVCTVLRSKYAP